MDPALLTLNARSGPLAEGHEVGRKLHLVASEDLREMLREQERTIEHQVRAMGDQDEKSRHLIHLSVAALAGGVALATVLLRGPDRLPPTVLGPLTLAAALNLTALVLFVDAYVGFREHVDAHVGPSPAWIAEKAGDSTWALGDHLLAQIEMIPRYFEHNMQVIGEAARRRRSGLHWLLSSLLMYAVGYIYILWEVIV